jgi:hypothetical protein
MFVKYMFTDCWNNRVDLGGGMENPSWQAVESAIRKLDGEHSTLVVLAEHEGDDHHMCVAGAWAERLMVYATKDNSMFFSLVDPALSRDKRLLLVGGQDGDYQERKCVPIAWALEAARAFYETGEMKASMNWVDDRECR